MSFITGLLIACIQIWDHLHYHVSAFWFALIIFHCLGASVIQTRVLPLVLLFDFLLLQPLYECGLVLFLICRVWCIIIPCLLFFCCKLVWKMGNLCIIMMGAEPELWQSFRYKWSTSFICWVAEMFWCALFASLGLSLAFVISVTEQNQHLESECSCLKAGQLIFMYLPKSSQTHTFQPLTDDHLSVF